MPYTVYTSFSQYRSNTVDIYKDDYQKALNSRNYLVEQIKGFPHIDDTLPALYGMEDFKPFGSLARRTKIRPIDDVDILLLLNGADTEAVFISGFTYWIKIKGPSKRFKSYMTEAGYLSSIVVLNKFRDALKNVHQYKNSSIKRSGVAVVLNLLSYDWSFDVVPAFPVGDGNKGISYYLIPDGKGTWMRTDPRKDDALVTKINKLHNGNALPLIRLIKYWNTYRPSPPTISSYYLEVMLLKGLEYQTPIVDLTAGISTTFLILQSSILNTCPDPKGLGPNLDNSASWDTREKVSESAQRMAIMATLAHIQEKKDDHKLAISTWASIFPNFPAYG